MLKKLIKTIKCKATRYALQEITKTELQNYSVLENPNKHKKEIGKVMKGDVITMHEGDTLSTYLVDDCAFCLETKQGLKPIISHEL